MSLHFRQMLPDEAPQVLALVMCVFDRFVAPDFSEQGIAEFRQSARRFIIEETEGHEVTVACEGDELLGMMDVRYGSHVRLFFVDPSHQGQGVGRGLLAAAVAKIGDAHGLTVNSAPSAVGAYRALGFEEVAEEAEVNGIRFVPMRKELR